MLPLWWIDIHSQKASWKTFLSVDIFVRDSEQRHPTWLVLCATVPLSPFFLPPWPSHLSLCFCTAANHFSVYKWIEAKIEENEKASSHRQSNPGHLWLEPPVLLNASVAYLAACRQTPLGVKRKFSPSGKNPWMLNDLLTLNAQSILPCAEYLWI